MAEKIYVNTFVVFFMIFTIVYIKGLSALISLGSVKPGENILVEGEATDQNVVDTLKQYYLNTPPLESYNIASHSTEYDPSQGQSSAIREIFNNKKDGVFVECGGVDGIFLSNTLYLERALHWRGLLIEADSNNYAKLEKTKRNAYTSNTCLSVTNRATVGEFSQVKAEEVANQPWWFPGIGKLSNIGNSFMGDDFNKYITKIKVQCFPFYSYMLALNISSIDYLSLDVEGAELEILQTIPFDKLEIKVLSVEWKHYVHNNTELNDFLKSKGYNELKQTKSLKWCDEDKIFIKDGVTLNHKGA